jgi:hypothetical protein
VENAQTCRFISPFDSLDRSVQIEDKRLPGI